MSALSADTSLELCHLVKHLVETAAQIVDKQQELADQSGEPEAGIDIRFTDADTGLSFELDDQSDDDRIVVTVSDNGQPMWVLTLASVTA